MQFVEVSSGRVLGESELHSAHPNTSFPSPLSASDVVDIGYAPIVESAVPAHDARLHRAVVQPPQLIDGVWRQAWTVEPLDPQVISQAIDERRAQLVQRIDADVDALIFKVIGHRSSEYELAEKEAAQFKSAGYAGDVPASVQSDASANGQSAQWSADRILATAATWRAAQSSLRAERLSAKAQATKASTHADLDSLEASWVAAMTEISSTL